MTEINGAEAKTFANNESAGTDRFNALAGKLGEMILDGLDAAKKVGEIVGGFFYFLSPVPKEFHVTPFKLKLEPIIKLKKA